MWLIQLSWWLIQIMATKKKLLVQLHDEPQFSTWSKLTIYPTELAIFLHMINQVLHMYKKVGVHETSL